MNFKYQISNIKYQISMVSNFIGNLKFEVGSIGLFPTGRRACGTEN